MSDTASKLHDEEYPSSDATRTAMVSIGYIRRGMDVQRYHTTRMVVGETVGHHSANVAMLCMLLMPECRLDLVAAALTHDLAEQATGDVPAQAKWASVALKEALDKLEDENTVFKYDLTPYELRVLKQADMLDLCFKAVEEIRMGNSTAEGILRRGLSFLSRNNPLPMTLPMIKELYRECK